MVLVQNRPFQMKELRDPMSGGDSPDWTETRVDLVRLRDLYQAGGQALHPALSCAQSLRQPSHHTAAPGRILFLCTQNSASSQMAEGLLRRRRRLPLEVFSAGNAPAQVHPLAVQTMADLGFVPATRLAARWLRPFYAATLMTTSRSTPWL